MHMCRCVGVRLQQLLLLLSNVIAVIGGDRRQQLVRCYCCAIVLWHRTSNLRCGQQLGSTIVCEPILSACLMWVCCLKLLLFSQLFVLLQWHCLPTTGNWHFNVVNNVSIVTFATFIIMLYCSFPLISHLSQPLHILQACFISIYLS